MRSKVNIRPDETHNFRNTKKQTRSRNKPLRLNSWHDMVCFRIFALSPSYSPNESCLGRNETNRFIFFILCVDTQSLFPWKKPRLCFCPEEVSEMLDLAGHDVDGRRASGRLARFFSALSEHWGSKRVTLIVTRTLQVFTATRFVTSLHSLLLCFEAFPPFFVLADCHDDTSLVAKQNSQKNQKQTW